MTVLLFLALAAGTRVEYRLVECRAKAARADLGRPELRKLWREARELAAFEVNARNGRCFSASMESRRTYLADYSVKLRRAEPRTGKLREGVRLWGWTRRGQGGGLILDTWVDLAEGGELREFKTRWGRVELPSLLSGGAGASCLLPRKKVGMVCWWQVPGSEDRVYALLARAETADGAAEAKAARAAPPEYVMPSFADGDVELEPEAQGPAARLIKGEPPPPGEPMFVELRLLRLKAALFDSSGGRPGAKELESWVRRKDAVVVGRAGLSSLSGRFVGACWTRRKAHLAGLGRDGTSVRWLAAGAAAGVRVRPEGDSVRVEARAWRSGFDEPFRTVKTRLGRVELPRYEFSSTGECSAKLKPGEEGVLGASPLEGGAMLVLTAKVEPLKK